MRKLVCSQPARTARPAHPVETYVRVGRGVGKTLMFLLRWRGGGEGCGCLQKLKLKLESKAKLWLELPANFMRRFMRVHYPRSSRTLRARHDDACHADNDKAGWAWEGGACVWGRGRGQSLSSLPDCLALPRILT